MASCFLFNVFGVLYRFLTNLRCNEVKCIILPSKSGKSELIKRLQSDKYHLLDIESQVALSLSESEREQLSQMNNESRLFYYPKCLAYLNEVKKNFKNEPIIIVLSSVQLAKYLKVKPKNILTFIPNNEFLQQLTNRMESKEDAERLVSSRLQILTETKAKSTIVFSSFDMLYQLLSTKLSLKPRL